MSTNASLVLKEEEIKKQIRLSQDLSEEVNLSKTVKLKGETVSSEIEESTSFSIPIVEYEINFLINDIKPLISKDILKIRQKNLEKHDNDFVLIKEDVDFEIIKDQVLNYVKSNPNIKTSEIIESLNFDTWLILEALDQLKDEGLLD
ncbi:MAG: hypothetical protein ACTSQE_16005 [Candidatus Heimdallarchaeaceae archaeon]